MVWQNWIRDLVPKRPLRKRRMSLSRYLRPNSAPMARKRLQTLLEHERRLIGQTDLITVLYEEILVGISRYVTVDPDKVQVKVHRHAGASALVLEIEIPNRTVHRYAT
jgi:cell division topological specificity factor